MTGIEDAYEEAKNRTIGELFNYLSEESNKKTGVELFKATRTLAEVGLAIYDFAEHIRRENAKNKRT